MNGVTTCNLFTLDGDLPRYALLAPVSDHVHFTSAVTLPSMTFRGVWSQLRPYKEVVRRLWPPMEEALPEIPGFDPSGP